MKKKVAVYLFVVVVIILFCVAGMFDTQLIEAGMIH